MLLKYYEQKLQSEMMLDSSGNFPLLCCNRTNKIIYKYATETIYNIIYIIMQDIKRTKLQEDKRIRAGGDGTSTSIKV